MSVHFIPYWAWIMASFKVLNLWKRWAISCFMILDTSAQVAYMPGCLDV